MKNTYLVYKDVNAEEKELVVATPQEWHSIMEENKRLPREQRRFFIKDCISDFEDIDCLYIETSREEYNRWHSRYEVSVQKRKCEKGYRMLSLDYFSDGDDNIPLQNVLASSEDVEKEVGSDMMMQELRRRLNEWKPWANELLDFYLAGKRASATRFFIQKYGISGTTVQKRKHQLDEFVKNFLKKY